MLEERAAFDEIEAYAREHKLHFLLAAVRQFQQWAHGAPEPHVGVERDQRRVVA